MKSGIPGSSATVVGPIDQQIQLELSGSTSGVCTTGRYPRGVQTQLIGDATYDLVNRRFTRFNFVAIGKRWGRTRVQ